MDIPSYDETLCPYCKHVDICNHNKFKTRIKHTTDFNSNVKVSKCEYYEYNKERQIDEISRRESIFFIGQD